MSPNIILKQFKVKIATLVFKIYSCQWALTIGQNCLIRLLNLGELFFVLFVFFPNQVFFHISKKKLSKNRVHNFQTDGFDELIKSYNWICEKGWPAWLLRFDLWCETNTIV